VCSTHPALPGTKPFCSISNIHISCNSCASCNACAILQNNALYIRLVTVIGLQFPGVSLSPSLYNKIVLAFFHSAGQNHVFVIIFICSISILSPFSLSSLSNGFVIQSNPGADKFPLILKVLSFL
jgi:hypothetical protein